MAGKQRSRGNAVSHGLTSTKLLPEVLGPDLIADCERRLREEYQPLTPTENFFVRDMARHDVGLPVPADQVLQEGDRVSISPVKIQGAWR